MNSSKERFIEAATRSLADNVETQLSTVSLLEQSVTCTGSDCDVAVARWDALDGTNRRFGGRTFLYLCLVIVSGWMLADGIRILLQFESSISCMCGSNFVDIFHNSPRVLEADIARELSDSQKMLLFGDMSETTKALRMKGLWNSDPENPAYFTDYAFAYLEENKKLPPDFLLTARRIDPDNAWFTYIAAGEMATSAVKIRPQSKTDRLGNIPPEWEIVNATALESSLKLLRYARGQQKCEYPLLEIQRKRAELLPTRDPAELTFALGYRYQDSSAVESKMRALGSAIAAKAWLCGKENDRDSFENLLIDANHLLKLRSHSEMSSFMGELINMDIAFRFVTNASPLATRFELGSDSARLESALVSVKRRSALREQRRRNTSNDLIYQRGSKIAGFVSIFPVFTLEAPPILPPDELIPGRLMDHETVAWTGAYFVWAILVVAMGTSVGIRYWQPPLIRQLAARLECLLIPRDWFMIVGAGVVAPILYFIWLTRFTPWGGRDFSVDATRLNIPYPDDPLLGWAQQCALALLVILIVGSVACACIRRRARPLGLVTVGSASLLVPIVCCAAFMPIAGWQVVHPSEAATAATQISGGITLAWLLLIAFRMVSGPYRCRIRHAVVGRVLVPCFAFAALLAISAAPVFKHLAYQWSAKDTLVRMDKDFPSGSEFEHRVALQYRKELRQTLGYDAD